MSSKQAFHFEETKSSVDSSIWVNEETWIIQILLTKEDIGLSDENIEFLGKVFEPKEEVHITVIGRDLGQKLEEAIRNDPEVESQVKQIVEEADWSYRIKDKMYHVAKDKKKVDSQGNFEVLHAESIILMVEVAGIEHFYEKLGRIIGMELEVPPTHVTLYTYGDPFGIGLPNQAAFEEFVTREILPNELKRLSPINVDQILKSLPEVEAGKHLWQNQFHEFDVYVHTLEFVKYIKEMTDDIDLVAAGYLHDIGKPKVAKLKYEDGVLQERETGKPYHTFTGHEEVGEEMVKAMDRELFEKLGLDQDRVASLVGCHYLPMKGIKAMRRATNYDEFLREYQRLEQVLKESQVPKEHILGMFLADILAQGKFCTDRDELFAIRSALLGEERDLRRIYDMQKEMHGNKE